MGKGEIDHNEQYLLFPKVFSTLLEHINIFIKLEIVSANSFSLEESKFDVWESVNSLPNEEIVDRSKLKDIADNKLIVA